MQMSMSYVCAILVLTTTENTITYHITENEKIIVAVNAIYAIA